MDRWNNLKSHFEKDGSLRDIIVTSDSYESWSLFFAALISAEYSHTFKHGDIVCTLPNSIDSIWGLQNTEPTLLSIEVGELLINCHFFKSYEIEFDLDPKDINSKSDFVVLLNFLTWLNKSIKSSVVLTHENSRDEVIFSVE
ncbi:hypothetical protein [Agarivorans sp. 1_MG-2023]|uniref:hypothetical protein n=1 Tax=Agarivorans sp. 1_MG-2023 TaxID=3062634 RepID=UPI0026E29BB6|nr:hypothetical protein [Agarivorans sp. 1_MG-2023]MDO6765951.1 hypothetical protein [Agarivorans sp. 1_MG-2023]